MATVSKALEWQGMGAAGSPESLPLSPYGGSCELLSWKRRIQNKNVLQVMVCHVLSIYCEKSIDLECVLALFYVSSQLTQ